MATPPPFWCFQIKFSCYCDCKHSASNFERTRLTPVAKDGGFVRLIGCALLAPVECSGHFAGDQESFGLSGLNWHQLYIRYRSRYLVRVGHKTQWHLVEIITFLIYHAIIRPTKIMNGAKKNWGHH